MKTKLLVLACLVALLSIAAFGQVKVTTESVKYERKGADISEWKKTIEINYPKFSGIEDKETVKRLERTFSYWRVFDTSLEQETENQWLENLDYTVKYNRNGILVMELWMSGSGAYPDTSKRTIVADDFGNPIRFKDTFQNRIGLLAELDKAQDAEMKATIKRMKEEKREEDAAGLFDNVRRASDEVEAFSVSDSGVTFLFDYGFPHALQALQPEGEYFFTWEQLKPYLREYSTIDMIGKKALAPGSTTLILDLRIGGILGGVKNGDYVDGLVASKQLKGPQPFVVIAPGETAKGLTIDKYPTKFTASLNDEQPDDICPDFRYATVSPEAKTGIAFSNAATWDPVPRAVTKLPANSPVYLGAVSDFLKTKGLPLSKPKISEIYKVDLDGDGTDEIVIAATNYTQKDFGAEKGGYSFVMVRKVIKGKAVDLLLGGDFITEEEMSAESTYEIDGIADLNADGNMEIVVYGAYYEGANVGAYKIENGVEKLVMETGCGL